MKKINNKGFALVETLIVTAFVVGIFSVMYANFYPMMGEYEKRENYDDISSIYKANLFKRLIEKYKTVEGNGISDNILYVTTGKITEEPSFNCVWLNPYTQDCSPITIQKKENKDYIEIDENIFSNNSDYQEYYNILVNNLNVEKIYLLPYKIVTFKQKVKDDLIDEIDTQTKEYIDYLPEFQNNPHNLACRIIVKFKAGENRESNESNSGEYKFATIGVNC